MRRGLLLLSSGDHHVASFSSRGFTLFESIVAMAIVAILTATAVPSFRSYVINQRAVTLANALSTDINRARSEALRRAGQVVLERAGSDWTQGWTVRDALSGSDISTQAALDHAILVNGEDASSIVFDPFGAIAQPSGGSTFYLCVGDPGSHQAGRRVLLSSAGHVEVLKPESQSAPCDQG